MNLKDKIKNTIFFFLNIFFSSIHPNKASILMYHSIGRNEVIFNVIPKDFERQMKYLKEKKYAVIKLKELVDKIKKGEIIRKKTVVLTFDDGYKDNFTNAFPVLKKYGFPGTIFLPTAYLGGKMDNSRNTPLDIMTWGEAREMEKSGLIDFAHHTHSHPEMRNIDFENFVREMEKSEKLLADNLGNQIKIFSYPRGRFKEEQVDYLRKAGYEAAVSTAEGLVGAGDDLYFLRRNFVYSAGGFSQFKGKLCKTIEIFNRLKNFLKYGKIF